MQWKYFIFCFFKSELTGLSIFLRKIFWKLWISFNVVQRRRKEEIDSGGKGFAKYFRHEMRNQRSFVENKFSTKFRNSFYLWPTYVIWKVKTKGTNTQSSYYDWWNPDINLKRHKMAYLCKYGIYSTLIRNSILFYQHVPFLLHV